MELELTEHEIDEAFRDVFTDVTKNDTVALTDVRFASTSEADIEEHLGQRVPHTTKSKEKWVVRLFKSWHNQWKVKLDGQLKVFDELEEMSDGDLCYCLKFFIADIRKTTGERYPPQTLKSIYYMIQHYLEYQCKRNAKLFKSPSFKEARDVLDAEMRLSARKGYVRRPKRAEPITVADEEKLWDDGLLGCSTPKQLQRTLIYSMGIQCGLRAASEHKALLFGKNSQLNLVKENDREVLIYTETVSKNKHFGLNQSRMEPKVVKVLPNNKFPHKCLISLYKTYISHRPPFLTEGPFHLACITSPKCSIWYKNQPLGIHQIERVTKDLMTFSGKDGYYTNTSLRRTAKSRMVEAGIPREVSKRRIGHLSEIDSVYIDASIMEEKVSRALYGNEMCEAGNSKCSQVLMEATDIKCNRPLQFNNCTFQNCSFNC